VFTQAHSKEYIDFLECCNTFQEKSWNSDSMTICKKVQNKEKA